MIFGDSDSSVVRLRLRLAFAVAFLTLVAALPALAHVNVFGPKTFTATKGAPQEFLEQIPLAGPCFPAPNATYTLIVTNGDAGGKNRVSSGSIALDGAEVVSERDFSQQSAAIERTVTVAAANTLRIRLNGPKDGTLSIVIRRHIDDTAGPVVTLGVAEGAVIGTSPFTLTGTVTDASGVASLQVDGAAVTPGAGGAFSTPVTLTPGPNAISVVATDCEGNPSVITRNVVLSTAPVLTIVQPAAGFATQNPQVALSGTVSAPAGIASVTANGQPMTVAGANWSGTLTFAGADGIREITVIATDAEARSTTGTVSVAIDRTAPVVTGRIEPPPNAEGWSNQPTTVLFTCSDATSGVQCKPFVVFGEEGAGQLAVSTAIDAAGNTATATVVVNIDFTAPVLTVEPIVSAARTPTVASAFLTLKGTVVETVSGLRSLTCNGNAATVTGTSYTCSVTLQAGINRVEIAAVDRADSRAAQFVNVTLDVTPPSLSIPAPGDGSEIIETDLFQLVGYTDDESGIASVTVNGQAAAFDQGKFVHQLQLREGDNAVTVVTTDKVGNARTHTVTLRRVTRVSIQLISPADLSTVNSATVTVTGTVSPSSANVVVNDVVATVSNGTFSAHGVPLAQGRTVITAIVTGPTGVVSVANLNIYRDSIPPRVTVYSPAERAVVRQSPITVTGMVDDIVVGTINGEQLTVTVNGVAASVRNRAFLATNVPLTPGSNTLTVVATDQGGNSTTVTRAVTYDTGAATKLTIVSGNAQQAAIGAALPAPLVVRLTGPTGAPVANAEVTFSIVQNNGTVSDGATTDRVVTVLTDGAGEARASWTLGERAGAGNNRVSAVAQGAGSVEFHATASTGAPVNVVVDTGSSQFGLVRERVQRPMIAVVVDSGSNRLADVPVTFTVTRGGGGIDGKQSVTVLTDSDGRAWVSPALGPERGNDNNVIEASVEGVAAKAVFVASGRTGGDPSQTRISGVVLDNMNLPIAGVTLRVDETAISARTDAQGQFVISNAPVGYVKLIVDGTTTSRAGTWPTLDFVMYTLPGEDNTLGMPVYLLPIDVQRGIQVDENRGGTLTFPELPGFALTVAPGSALFPNGSRAGTVSATMVHHDKMPMPPNFGQQPRFIVTIQPTGVHFDPPAKLTLPNLDGLAPGEVTEMFSFDHDLGQFVSIGTGSASSDGSVIESDPGVGIIKGGWHSAGNPNPTGDTSAVNVRVNGPSTATVGQIVNVVASGTPATGGAYFNWQVVSNPSAAQFLNQPACPGQPTCTAQLRILGGGAISVQVSFMSSATTGSSLRRGGVVAAAAAPATSTQHTLYVPVLEIDAVIFAMSHTINKDKVGGASLVSPTQWTRPVLPGDSFVQEPVAYTRSEAGNPRRITLKVKFAIRSPLATTIDGVTITGTGGGMTWTKPNVSIPAGATSTPWMEITSEDALPDKTAFFNPLVITWKHTLPGAASEFPAGGSANPLYVTLKDPRMISFSDGLLLTALHLAVSRPGAAAEQEAVTRSWSFFANPDGIDDPLQTWDGRKIHYYLGGFMESSSATVLSALTSPVPNGACGMLARLYAQVLAANGIDSNLTIVEALDGSHFMVNHWAAVPPSEPSEPILAGGHLYPWKLVISPEAGVSTWGLTMSPPQPSGQYGDMVSLIGVPGQNTTTPSEKIFFNHIIVQPDLGPTIFYDPSYGITHTGPPAFELNIFGYARRNPKVPSDPTQYIARPKTGTLNIKFGVTPW